MTAQTALATDARREIYLDRRVCTLTPDRIDVHPARSIVFLPLLTLLIGLAAFPVIYFWGGSLSLGLRLLLTLGAVVLVPLSGVGLVYSHLICITALDPPKGKPRKDGHSQRNCYGFPVSVEHHSPPSSTGSRFRTRPHA